MPAPPENNRRHHPSAKCDTGERLITVIVRFCVGFVVGAIAGIWSSRWVFRWWEPTLSGGWAVLMISVAVGLGVGVLAIRHGTDVWNRLGWGP